MSREKLLLDAVRRGKYAPLFLHLSGLQTSEWSTSFRKIEDLLGFPLPKSARIYRPWWANDRSSGHSQSIAWSLAGWITSEVDMEAERLTFRRKTGNEGVWRNSVEEAGAPLVAPPKMNDFRTCLMRLLEAAHARGFQKITMNAGELHRAVGGYPTPFNRMTMCCKAMREEQRPGDRLLQEPPSGFGASLAIEYCLPRS